MKAVKKTVAKIRRSVPEALRRWNLLFLLAFRVR